MVSLINISIPDRPVDVKLSFSACSPSALVNTELKKD